MKKLDERLAQGPVVTPLLLLIRQFDLKTVIFVHFRFILDNFEPVNLFEPDYSLCLLISPLVVDENLSFGKHHLHELFMVVFRMPDFLALNLLLNNSLDDELAYFHCCRLIELTALIVTGSLLWAGLVLHHKCFLESIAPQPAFSGIFSQKY